ncbi:hypothetical protein [Paraburkholderia adhaesiva]|uniref:hypothetical protein n=1 Tax=Paraburkholderia adhaesiva TaxID=2883244 RepID=UPI001F272DA3|nr:hypothetical protein [Paraburkholderia adhaesiva]
MATTPSYPFDPTGSLASNLITGEQQVLVAQNYRDQHLIIPAAAPYFADTLQIQFKDTSGQITTLKEGTDYFCTYWFISASRSCAMRIYGSVSFINTALSGVVQLRYQTLGGIWVLDAATVAQLLASSMNNARVTSWEEISGTPYAFPPEAHTWDVYDMVGMDYVVAALAGIQDTLQQTGGAGLAAHEADHSNPHIVTAVQVGLGNVQNYAMAASSDAVAGTSTTLYMTPAATSAAIQSQVLGPFLIHVSNTANPHQVTAAQVGLGNVQNYGVASKSDAVTGASTTLYMTPVATAAAINGTVGLTINQHLLNTSNPHLVSAAQVGLGNVRNLSTASSSDAITGTSNDLYMTPAATAAAIAATGSLGQMNAHLTDYSNPHRVTAAQTGAITLDDASNLLQACLPVSATAADTTLAYGMTLSELTAQILAGTASNAATVGGMTPQELLSYVASGASSDATTFGGMSPTDWQTYIANATVANSNLAYGLTQSALTAAILTGTAGNANQLAGMPVADLTASILSGTAANSTLAYGLTQSQLASAILQGTAANATLFNGMTSSALIQMAVNVVSAAVAAQEFIAENTDAVASVWTPLGQVAMPGAAQTQSVFPDVQWIVAGGDAITDTDSGAWLVRVSVRAASAPDNVRLGVTSLNGMNMGTVSFGFTVDSTTTPGAPVLTVWMQTPGETNPMTVTSLSTNTTQLTGNVNPVTTEPAGIVYSAADEFAKFPDLSGVVDNLITAFTTLSSSLVS